MIRFYFPPFFAYYSDALRQAFNAHLSETKNHVSRLKQVLENIGENIIDEIETNTAQRDAGLIIAGQKSRALQNSHLRQIAAISRNNELYGC